MRKSSNYFLTILFGPIGDTLMALALFDDILTLDPEATLLILARRNVQVIQELALEYPQVKVLQIPNGFNAILFYARIIITRCIFLTLGVTGAYSMRLKTFLFVLSNIPGNRTIGFNDQAPGVQKWLPLQTILQFDGNLLIIDNFRRLLENVYDPVKVKIMYWNAPRVRLRKVLAPKFESPYILLHMYGDSIRSAFPQRRWVSIVQLLREKFPKIHIILTGASSQREKLEEIARTSSGVSLCVGERLLTVAALVDQAVLYIGIDTGITHIAGVLQQKSLILSHFGDPTWVSIYNPNARVLVNSIRCKCGRGGQCEVQDAEATYHRCTYDISDATIIDSVCLALSSDERHVPSFVGLVDENSAKSKLSDNS